MLPETAYVLGGLHATLSNIRREGEADLAKGLDVAMEEIIKIMENADEV